METRFEGSGCFVDVRSLGCRLEEGALGGVDEKPETEEQIDK